MFKLKISQKSLGLFLIISLLPLALVNAYWLRTQQNTLRNAAAHSQVMLTESAAEQVEQFMSTKVNTVILHSQTSSVQEFQLKSAQKEFLAFIQQDKDLERVSLVDIKGQEISAVTKNGLDTQLVDVSTTDAFRAATFLAGKEYISSVSFNEQQQPQVTIAVPLVSFETRQSLSSLSTAEPGLIRNSGDIKGVIIAKINLKDLWERVLSTSLGKNGYAYVVDGQGKLVAYPEPDFIKTSPDLSQTEQVAKFIEKPNVVNQPSVTTSEKNIKVLSVHQAIPRTGWAVVAQEPVASIFAPANQVAKVTIGIFIIFAIATTLLSLLFSRTLTRPIRALVAGTSQLSSGNLDTRIQIKSNDEIGILGTRFNKMADSLKLLILSLKAETTKLGVLIESVADGVVALDHEDKIVFSNVTATAMAGKLPIEVVGQNFLDVFDLSKNGIKFEMTNDSLYHLYKEVLLISFNKRLHYLDMIVNRIANDPSGIKTIITLRDQTDERELDMMKLDFVSMAAHELRTPITAIRGYLSLILEDEQTTLSMESKNFVDRAQVSSKLLAGLISNLLNVSRIERGIMKMNTEKIEWTNFVQGAVNDNRYNAENKKINIIYDKYAESITVDADEPAIGEVLNNLISNAINYTPENGQINVGTFIKNSDVITYVKDTGIGIPENAVERLFTKFYRVQGGIASGSGGTGLGLYISKSIMDLHKGKIWVNSVLGKGSVFSFSLPLNNNVEYMNAEKHMEEGLKKKHGWVTKNITR